MESSPFDNTLKRCKYIENRLDSRVQRYVMLVQKLNNHAGGHDIEDAGSREERDLGIEIEKDLYEMSECIQSMTDSVSNNGKEYNKESIIKKYQEIQYDYRSEYKRASSSLTYNNPSAYQQLLGNAYYNNNNNKKSDNDALLRERNSITSSMSSIYDVINNASDIKKTLASQRGILTNASGGLSGLLSNIPSFNRLIEGINKKKSKETLIIALFIAVLLFFTIWWILLR